MDLSTLLNILYLVFPSVIVFYFLLQKKFEGAVLIFFTIFTAYYDFMFLTLKVELGYYQPFAIGALYDVFVLMFFLKSLLVSAGSKSFNVKLLLMFTLFIIFNGLIHFGVSDIILGYRSYVSTLLLLIGILIKKPDLDFKYYLNALIVFVFVPNITYAMYQMEYYKTLESFWFYSAYQFLNLEIMPWDFFRNEMLRPFGFFTSTLGLGFLSLSVFMGAFYYHSGIIKYLLMTSSFITILLTGVRGILLSLIIYLFMYSISFIRFPSFKKYIYLGSIPAFFIITLGAIYYGTNEPSALHRLTQWKNVLDFLYFNPFGLGVGSAGQGLMVWPDSQFISYLYMGGVISIFLFFYCYYRFIKYHFQNGFVISLFISLCYLCLFQNIGYYFVWIFFFYMISISKVKYS
ncbi:hypothetical protein [Aeromonas encheleia]